MTDQELDALMRRVLLDGIEQDCVRKQEAEPPFRPTPRYHRQMTAMLTNPLKWERRRNRPVWKTVMQRAAVILITVSLGFGGVMLFSPTARAAVLRCVEEWTGTRLAYRYAGEERTEAMPRYEITGLPEGFTETGRDETPAYVSVTYENAGLDDATAGTIYLTYADLHEGGALGVEIDEDIVALPVTVNGLEGRLFLYGDREDKWNTVVWTDSEANLQFTLDAATGETDILHMAESVSLCKPTK